MLATTHLYRQATLRWLLIEAIQRAWRRHQVIVSLYPRLADRAPDERHEILLIRMAEQERFHQQRYERMLTRLHALPSEGLDSFDRVWLWLLPRCGSDIALRWAEWIEQRDTRAILDAALLLRAFR
jgi:hypothetical protein